MDSFQNYKKGAVPFVKTPDFYPVGMLHIRLHQMSIPDRPTGATDDDYVLKAPKAHVAPMTLFSKPPTPESPDPFDEVDTPLPGHQMRTLLPERANCDEKFTYAIDRLSFDHLFKCFARFGDSKSNGEAITLTNSDRWFRQAKVIDNRRISTTDTGIYFKQIAKVKKALTKQEFEQYLDLIAKKKSVNPSHIRYKLSSCGPPRATKATEVDNRSAIRRLTDHTRYTGTHRQRFDHTGKGLGREGRMDFFDNSGYVYGYKSQGTYSRFH